MNTPAPNNILELSQHNTIVHGCMEYWLEGLVTWEQALMMSVVLLASQNEQLEKSAVKDVSMRPTLKHYS